MSVPDVFTWGALHDLSFPNRMTNKVRITDKHIVHEIIILRTHESESAN